MRAVQAVDKYKKVRLPKTPKGIYATLNGFGVLVWVEEVGVVTGPVSLINQNRRDWEAYRAYDKKVADLEESVENFKRENRELRKIIFDRAAREAHNAFTDFMNDSKIERIVVEDVFWKETDEYFAVPNVDGEPEETDLWRRLPGKGKCKMILEFKK